ncbi:Transcriptional activator, partial [Steccherinum ochraceum]
LSHVGFSHPMSHSEMSSPVSPAPAVSPNPHQAHDRLQQQQHHGHHDHSRRMTSMAQPPHLPPQEGTGSQPPQLVQPVGRAPAASSSSVTLRSPYAAMQMHHVPHPHAHARHHHSYVNRNENLYGDENRA